MLDFISTIAANRDSGRLNVATDGAEGALLFKDGKLVDARVGSLRGFQAINALASMHDVRFSFDPTVVPRVSNSITASERVVLKQFFGVETVEAPDYDEVELAPVPGFSWRRALVMAAVVLVIGVSAAVLIFMSRESSVRPTEVSRAESTSEPAPVASAPIAPADDATAAVTSAPAAQDLTGKWNVINTVETTSYQSFKNMKIGFALSLNQNGTRITGEGQKVSENGRSLPAGSRTPIQVQGSIDGNRIEATFYEEGTARKSNGRFVWRIDNSGNLKGIFATTAARSSGKSAARREL
jgi:uncharacterized protein DUF4388